MEIADETASISNAKKKKIKAEARCEHGGVSVHSIGNFCHWTGVCACRCSEQEGRGSEQGSSESGMVSEQCDKTLSPSNADLMSVLCKMNSKLDSLHSVVNELTELKNENACMKMGA